MKKARKAPETIGARASREADKLCQGQTEAARAASVKRALARIHAAARKNKIRVRHEPVH
jgi:hypothetical protein